MKSEAALLKRLGELRADTVVLARYMQVLSGEFLRAWNKPIVNIHHSFLPAFAGQRPHKQAHDRGVKLIGATAHYVTEELDAGPIIAQAATPMTHRDTVADLARKGKDLEVTVLAKAVRAHLRKQVLLHHNRTSSKNLSSGAVALRRGGGQGSAGYVGPEKIERPIGERNDRRPVQSKHDRRAGQHSHQPVIPRLEADRAFVAARLLEKHHPNRLQVVIQRHY